MIGKKFYKQNYSQEEYETAVDWCDKNNATIEDKGEYFEVVAIASISLKELKDVKLTEVNRWTESKITGGFVSEATGEPIIYDSDVDTQITVSRMRANCEGERFAELFPNGMECRGRRSADAEKEVFMLQPDEIIRLDEDLGIHIRQSKIDGWTKQAQVKAATSKEELEKITLD